MTTGPRWSEREGIGPRLGSFKIHQGNHGGWNIGSSTEAKELQNFFYKSTRLFGEEDGGIMKVIKEEVHSCLEPRSTSLLGMCGKEI